MMVMKKCLLFLIVSMFAFAAGAQSKITKETVVGNWKVAALEVKDLLFFSVEKDSIALADTLKKTIISKGMDPKNVETMMKQQFGMFVSMQFSFDADGKAKFVMGLEQTVESSYTVDAETSTIKTVDGDGQSESMKAEMVNGMLRLLMPDPSGQEVWVVLKKTKS
jgi:hypothetical protein